MPANGRRDLIQRLRD